MTKKSLLILFLMSLYLSACATEKTMPELISPTAVAEIQPNATATKPAFPTATSTSTPTSTRLPTSTPIFYVTMTPFPTVTPIGVYPVKQILMQTDTGGGDGGDVLHAYLGHDSPNLVIYADGQIIIKGPPILSGQLPTDELCSLLTELDAIGYFEPILDDMIYVFDDTTQFSDGGGYYHIQVNGPLNNRVGIYGDYWDYAIDEVTRAYELVSNYQPPIILTPYIPERLILWMEPTTDTVSNSLPDWPANLPSLAALRDPTTSQVVIEGDLILPLMELFEYQLGGFKQFREGDTNYNVILRPLLPHETPRYFSSFMSESVAFDLPFTCDDIDLPELIPTPTPSPIPGTIAPEAKELHGRIVYTSDQDGNDEIYVMYADGSGATRLTNHPGDDKYPAWSPDGQKIAFISDRSKYDELYVMDADGTNVTRLTFTLYDKYSSSEKYAPKWSPDGTRIVYINRRLIDFPRNKIYVLGVEDADSDPRQLTYDGRGVEGVSPIWLNLTQVMYTSDSKFYVVNDDVSEQGLKAGQLPGYSESAQVVSGDGSELFLLSSGGPGSDISPDGKQLTYYSAQWVDPNNDYHSVLYQEIFIASISDLITTEEDASVRITEEGGSNHSPAWSPDGQHIVFVSERDGNAELYIMNPDGSNPIRLTFTANSERDPDWAP